MIDDTHKKYILKSSFFRCQKCHDTGSKQHNSPLDYLMESDLNCEKIYLIFHRKVTVE